MSFSFRLMPYAQVINLRLIYASRTLSWTAHSALLHSFLAHHGARMAFITNHTSWFSPDRGDYSPASRHATGFHRSRWLVSQQWHFATVVLWFPLLCSNARPVSSCLTFCSMGLYLECPFTPIWPPISSVLTLMRHTDFYWSSLCQFIYKKVFAYWHSSSLCFHFC
jgi:hypothetical protein